MIPKWCGSWVITPILYLLWYMVCFNFLDDVLLTLSKLRMVINNKICNLCFIWLQSWVNILNDVFPGNVIIKTYFHQIFGKTPFSRFQMIKNFTTFSTSLLLAFSNIKYDSVYEYMYLEILLIVLNYLHIYYYSTYLE